MTAPNFREYVCGRASWLDRLRCRIFGHADSDRLGAVIERLQGLEPFCHRCGGDLGVKP